MRETIVSCALTVGMLWLAACGGKPTGPRPVDYFDEYSGHFDEAERLERAGKRMAAINEYKDAKKALEDLKLAYPKETDYFDETDLAYVKDKIAALEDEERRGVEAMAAADKGPPPPPEPELTGELYDSIKAGIVAKLGETINTEPTPLDRVKQIEPWVIDNIQTLKVEILANERFIEGMMVQQVKQDLKEVLKVLKTHSDDLKLYPQIILGGYKVVAGADGLAEAVLMVEYRYTQEAFQAVDVSKIDDDDFDLKKTATKATEL